MFCCVCCEILPRVITIKIIIIWIAGTPYAEAYQKGRCYRRWRTDRL